MLYCNVIVIVGKQLLYRRNKTILGTMLLKINNEQHSDSRPLYFIPYITHKTHMNDIFYIVFSPSFLPGMVYPVLIWHHN